MVTGSPSEYALTGIRAFVDWEQGVSPQGNMLWKLMPRPDIAGAEVGSSDHVLTSPAPITAYAVGIKLVPGHS